MLKLATILVLALASAGCGRAQKTNSAAEELAALRARLAVESLRPVLKKCRAGEVLITISPDPSSSESTCVEPRHAAARVAQMLRGERGLIIH
ncbi:MAG TPA: hypothetical protein VGN08_08705 [Solirubrobacteraceae bacterium]